MKITFLTTLISLAENRRIAEEIESLGHEFNLVSLKEFDFSTRNGKFTSDFLDNFESDIIIVRGVFNAMKPISALLLDMQKNGVKIFDNNFLDHQYSINKIADIVKLSLSSIPVPDTVYTREFKLYPKKVKSVGYPAVIKSTRTGKGASVFKLNSPSELESFIKTKESQGKEAKNFLIQEFIPYEYDLRCLIIGKDVFTMRRIPGEGEFRANFSLGGSVELFDLDEPGLNLAKSALRAINMSVGGVDILITPDNRRYILEVNHTAGMIGMEKATEKNITKLYVEHAINHAK